MNLRSPFWVCEILRRPKLPAARSLSDERRASFEVRSLPLALSQLETQLRATYPELNLQGKRNFDSVARARQQYAVPILNEFKAWLDAENNSGRILPKSLIRIAFTYTLNQWKALNRYTE
jgi:hypothetical protein